MSIASIVLIIIGIGLLLTGYLLPVGKETDRDTRAQMEKDVHAMVRRSIEDAQEEIRRRVDDTIEESLVATERTMEKATNEKVDSISEYAETVLSDIHKNHEEVMFMYDMLNDKHKNLSEAVSEVSRKADEARQTVLDAEKTAEDARLEAQRLAKVSVPTPAAPVRPVAPEPAVTEATPVRPVQDPEPARGSIVQGFLKQAAAIPVSDVIAEDDPHIIRPQPDAIEKMMAAAAALQAASRAEQENEAPAMEAEDPRKVVSIRDARASAAAETTEDGRRVQVVDLARAAERVSREEPVQPAAPEPMSKNRQILEMHKAGKSNMVIARELGLGIGEVGLIIDLSDKQKRIRSVE